MSRQLNFYASDADRKIIADILHKHFGEMIEVPSHKDSLQLFEDTVDKSFNLLTDLDSKEHITYREHTYYDQREALVLDEYNSCILEYSTAFKNPTGAYVIFIYLKPQKLYISKNIDLDSALFLLSNRIVKLSTDGCGRGHTRCKKAPSVKVIPDKINIFNKK